MGSFREAMEVHVADKPVGRVPVRQTHTYVTMDVPAELRALVRQKLLDAGYDHAVDDKAGELDMHGIALVPGERD